MRPGAEPYASPDEAVSDEMLAGGGALIGTPDDMIKAVKDMIELTGGFGTVIGFAHDWANREATLRSWDMVARYVIPEVNGMLEGYRESQQYVIKNREVFDRAGEAVMANRSLKARLPCQRTTRRICRINPAAAVRAL
jgi:limonene 1,2-monooxygenase